MKTSFYDNYIELSEIEDFDPKLIFDCGQCFRFEQIDNNTYEGVAFNKVLRVETVKNKTYRLYCSKSDFENIWYDFFDLDLDYSDIRKKLSVDPFTIEAIAYGKGIRILKQDFWEGLCSFIISQCNNIPRIKSIISTLCKNFGEKIDYNGKIYYSFPSAEKISTLSLDDLSVLRSGYRAPYILNAAKKIASGELNAINGMTTTEAEKYLLTLEGIGPKVCNCVLLFALHRLDCFPIDTWMKKAISDHYPKDFNPSVFGEYAGIAQQYIFNYKRVGIKNE